MAKHLRSAIGPAWIVILVAAIIVCSVVSGLGSNVGCVAAGAGKSKISADGARVKKLVSENNGLRASVDANVRAQADIEANLAKLQADIKARDIEIAGLKIVAKEIEVTAAKAELNARDVEITALKKTAEAGRDVNINDPIRGWIDAIGDNVVTPACLLLYFFSNRIGFLRRLKHGNFFETTGNGKHKGE